MTDLERTLPIPLPELATGRGAWQDLLTRLAADPHPDNPVWERARAAVADQLAWFDRHPDLDPAHAAFRHPR